VTRKRPEISTEVFRHFRKVDYGPTYAGIGQVREFEQYRLADLTTDGAKEDGERVVDEAGHRIAPT
jgi:hypothetical protein